MTGAIAAERSIKAINNDRRANFNRFESRNVTSASNNEPISWPILCVFCFSLVNSVFSERLYSYNTASNYRLYLPELNSNYTLRAVNICYMSQFYCNEVDVNICTGKLYAEMNEMFTN